MRVGVPTEIKVHEYRVGLTPSAVREYVARGHKVMVQSGAGAGIMATDEAYKKAGAKIVKTAEEIFAKAEMVVKVKEPQPNEWVQLREGQLLFTYLHLAPDPKQPVDVSGSAAAAVGGDWGDGHCPFVAGGRRLGASDAGRGRHRPPQRPADQARAPQHHALGGEQSSRCRCAPG